MDTSILESKLKRHKISFSCESGTIVIGKPKKDYVSIVGLVIFPITVAIAISLFLVAKNFGSFGMHKGKIIGGVALLFGTGVFNFSRVRNKKLANNNLKVLDREGIKIINEFGQYRFDLSNIKEFVYSAKQVDKETYEGNLFLVDTEGRNHQIIGFDDENEKYVLNDLKWFSNYFLKHLEMK